MSNRKKKIIIFVAAVLAVVALWWLSSLFSSGSLELSVPNTIPGDTTVNIEISGGTLRRTKTIELTSGKQMTVRLSPGTVQVQTTAGSIRSIDIVQIKRSHTAKLTTPLGEQKKIQQFASSVSACLVDVPAGLFSYSCGGSTAIIRHQTTATFQSNNSLLFGGQKFGYLTPVGNGLLTFEGSNTAKLNYIDLSTSTITPVPLPGAISSLKDGYQPQIVSSRNPSSTRFALISPASNKIYLFRSTADTAPIELKLGAGLSISDKRHNLFGSFSGDTLVLYDGIAGSSSGDGEGEGTAPAPDTVAETNAKIGSAIDSYLFEYDTSGNLTRQILLPNNLSADDGVFKVTGNYYIVGQSGVSTFYYYDGKHFTQIYSLRQVGTWVTLNNKAYVQADRSLYEFSPGNNGLFGLHSLFYSEDIFVSTLFTGNGGVLFSGFTGSGDQQQLNAYRLGTAAANGAAQDTQPTYEGFDAFLNYGATVDQIDNIKSALGQYAHSAQLHVKKLSITDLKVTSRSRYNPDINTFGTFTVSFDGKIMKAKAELPPTPVARVFIYNLDDTQVFDSGYIDHQNVSL